MCRVQVSIADYIAKKADEVFVHVKKGVVNVKIRSASMVDEPLGETGNYYNTWYIALKASKNADATSITHHIEVAIGDAQ